MLPAAIPSPPSNTIHAGPIPIHVYGLIVATAIIVGVAVTRRRYRRLGGNPAIVDVVALWAILAAVAGARLAFIATRLGQFSGNPLGVFAIWQGGLAFYGGLVAGTAAGIVVLRRRHAGIALFADAAAIGLPLAHAIGRWACYFAQELFGTPSTLPWAIKIDPGNRPARYAAYSTFHPTFLYESLWNVATVIVLLAVARRGRLVRGSLFLAYVGSYGIGRFLMELLRTDTTFRFLGISRNGWFAAATAIAAFTAVAVRQHHHRNAAGTTAATAPTPETA